MRAKTEGQKCGRSSIQICSKELVCAKSVCQVPNTQLKKDCLPEGSICAVGTVCAGMEEEKKCVIPMTDGKRCGRDPFWVCDDGLECANNTCRHPLVPPGGDCLPEHSICMDGYICVGRENKKMCKKPMMEGENCGKDPFWVCHESLTCVDNKCAHPAVPPKGDCLPEGSVCEEGTICTGTEKKRKCVMPMTEGKNCGTDPFWVCEEYLECVRNRCRRPPVLPEGDCLHENSVCTEGYSCVGRNNKKKCKKPMTKGEKCGTDPFWVCEEGLQCMKRKCVLPPVPPKGDCLPEGSVCEDGYVCAGTKQKKKCVVPMPVDKRCGNDPLWVCEAHLQCIDGTCRNKDAIISPGGDCSYSGAICHAGTICKFVRGSRSRCLWPTAIGRDCDSLRKRILCEKDFSCVNGVCKTVLMERGATCSIDNDVCGPGLRCAHVPRMGTICQRAVGVNSSCGGTNNNLVCHYGLQCAASGVCEHVMLRRGNRCEGVSSLCPSGTTCIGGRLEKRCMPARRLKKSCGIKWWQVCGDGLYCVDGSCHALSS